MAFQDPSFFRVIACMVALIVGGWYMTVVFVVSSVA